MAVWETSFCFVPFCVFIAAGMILYPVRAQTGRATTAPAATDNTVVTSGSSIFGGGGLNSRNSGSASTGFAGTSSMPMQAVAYDIKSASNPNWVMFLEEVARQTSRTLADLQTNAVNDPIIGAMWDIYVQTLGEGSALPTGGGLDTSSKSNSGGRGGAGRGGGAGDGGGTADGLQISLYGGDVGPQEGAAIADGGTASATSGTSGGRNWFRPFFRAPENIAHSFTVSRVSGQPLQASSRNNSAGAAARSTFSIDQMFSVFRLPSSSSFHMPQAAGSLPNVFNLLRSVASSSAPGSSSPGSASASLLRLPDSAWTSPSGSSTSTKAGQLSSEQLQQLSSELLKLLGTPLAEASSTSASSSALRVSLLPSPGPTLTGMGGHPAGAQRSSLSQSRGTFSAPEVPASAVLAAKGVSGPFGLASSGSSFPALPQRAPAVLSQMDFMKPVLNIYNANFNTGASLELGCKTLAEALDMEVSRPVDPNCNNVCPNLMTGKRVGTACMCCPYYVSDQAIETRSMARQMESLI